MKKFLSAMTFAAILLSVAVSGWCDPVLYQDPTTGQVFTKPGEGRVPVDLSTLSQAPAPQSAPSGDYSSQAFKDAVENVVGEKESNTFPKIKIGGLMYGEYYYNFDRGEADNTAKPNAFGKQPANAFLLNRGYLNVFADLTPQIGARITSDLSQVGSGAPNSGDWEYRLKYYYVDFHKFMPGYDGLEVKMGQFQTPWLDYEEGLWEFRVIDNMLIEKEGFINAGDLGVDFRGPLPKGYGSWQVSVDNGAGYHGAETNKYKAVEARLTLCPLPQFDATKGLQFSGYTKIDKSSPLQEDYRYIAFAAYKYKDDAFLAGEYDWTRGADKTATYEPGLEAISALPLAKGQNNMDGRGFSAMAWARMPFLKPLRVLGRFDQFRHDVDVAGTTVTRYIYGVSYDVNKNVMFVLDDDRTTTGNTLKTKANYLDNNLAKVDVQVQF